MLVIPPVEFRSFDGETVPASFRISRFRGSSGVDEYDIIVRPRRYGSIETQLEWVSRAYLEALDSVGLDPQTAVLRRFFCSDIANQAPAHSKNMAYEPCAVSWICQAPAPPAKVALWAHHVSDPGAELDKVRKGASLVLRRGDLSHHWTAGLGCTSSNTSYDQTRSVLRQYDAYLRANDMSLGENAMRTWLFVRNIDANYPGLVAARRDFFAEHGLTPDTHFIASTGIEGASSSPAAKVTMDAYAISGLRPGQVRYLAAPDHLSPTHVYGVTFERATSIDFRDRRHVYVSGTASINAEGRIVHAGDVSRQLDRTVENVEALLKQAGATLRHMSAWIAYVRDPADHTTVRQQLRERLGDAPFEVVTAAVCRPGWLVELEGHAILPATNPDLPPF